MAAGEWKSNKGNYMKKMLLGALAVAVACAVSVGAAPAAYAAPAYGKVKVAVTQDYGDAQEVLKLVNSNRKKAHLSKLKMDKSLTKAAIQRAAEVGIFVPFKSPHRRPNGKLSGSVNGKISYECCAEGYQSPAAVMKGWMGSPPHRRGILLSSAKSVGIGCVRTGGGDTIWTLEFSGSKAKKVQKSKKVVSYTKTVKAKSAYLKSKFFKMASSAYGDFEVGQPGKMSVYYSSKYNVTNTGISPKSFKWKSSNPSVISITQTGAVKANAAGSATITATSKKGPKITVKKTVRVVAQLDGDDWAFALGDI